MAKDTTKPDTPVATTETPADRQAYIDARKKALGKPK